MLHVSRFHKSYHGHPVLDVPDLAIPPGVHWIQGSNGSGKTSFFRCIAGLLPFEGRILLHGKFEVNRNPVDYRLRVNYGEAEPFYPPFLCAADLIGFVAKTKKAPAGQVEELVEVLDIGSFLKQPCGTYSSGMLKKTSLVLAFLGNPELVLLDEPLITVDKQAVDKIYALVNRYHDQKGVSFLLSSHQDFRLSELTVSNRYQVLDHKIELIS